MLAGPFRCQRRATRRCRGGDSAWGPKLLGSGAQGHLESKNVEKTPTPSWLGSDAKKKCLSTCMWLHALAPRMVWERLAWAQFVSWMFKTPISIFSSQDGEELVVLLLGRILESTPSMEERLTFDEVLFWDCSWSYGWVRRWAKVWPGRTSQVWVVSKGCGVQYYFFLNAHEDGELKQWMLVCEESEMFEIECGPLW